MTGRPFGRLGRPAGHGIGAFVREDGGSTTLAAAVAILVCLALVFSLSNVAWVNSRSADVQAAADAGALAGANVLSRYVTCAQVVDSVVLSLGLVGMTTMAIGLVMCAIPVVDVAGAPVVEAANKVFAARSKLSKSAASGLSQAESALPYLMAANSLATIRANATESGSFVGVALPFPMESETDFGLLELDDILDKTQRLKDSGDTIDSIEKTVATKKQEADDAKTKGWLADCGGAVSMYERAYALAGLPSESNPYYPSVSGWDFGVAIRRAYAYYQVRFAAEPTRFDGSDVEEMNRSSARRAFYEYAIDQVGQSSYTENDDGSVICDLHELPSNTEMVRQTSLYFAQRWPCTLQDETAVMHSNSSCPGATGPDAGWGSFSQQEAGLLGVCPTCGFTVADQGRASSASTNIGNGFEHYWREVVRASEMYEGKRNEQVSLESQARQEAESANQGFSEAIDLVKTVRVKLAPPGRYGCVCVVADAQSHLSPEELTAFVGRKARLPARVAISGAVLAIDPATKGNSVLAEFFDRIVASGYLGQGGTVLDSVMTTWGDLLVSYGDTYTAFSNGVQDAFRRLEEIGFGGVASWLRGALSDVIELTAMEPADLSSRKPVLIDTNSIVSKSGNNWYAMVQKLVMVAPDLSGASDVSTILSILGVYVESLSGEDGILIAELEIPGTEVTIPIELDFGWLADLTKRAA